MMAPSDNEIYERIVSAILEHRLHPGTKLGEERLAEIFSVSRARVTIDGATTGEIVSAFGSCSIATIGSGSAYQSPCTNAPESSPTSTGQ